MLHTIGDSHCQEPIGKIPGVVCHHVGPRLCHSIGRDGVPDIGAHLRPGDSVLFSFGSIDCIRHLHKYVTPERPLQTEVNELLDAYLAAIQSFMASRPRVRVAVYNVLPMSRVPPDGIDWPGTAEARFQHEQVFNRSLKMRCWELNYLFIDVRRFYSDPEGYLRPDAARDRVHVDDPGPIEATLRRFSILTLPRRGRIG